MNRLVATFAACALLIVSASALAQGDYERGKEKSKPCQQCHGANGNSTAPQFPRLAGQYVDYMVKALEDYKSGARKNAIMNGMAASLSAQDREDIATYFSAQRPGLKTITHFQ